MDREENLTELNEAARRAGYIVTEQIESIVQRAEHEAETIRRQAQRDADDVRREAVESAKRLLDRLHALEFPLGELVMSLRDEVEQVSRELGKTEQHVDSEAASLPPADESGEFDDADAGAEAEEPSPGDEEPGAASAQPADAEEEPAQATAAAPVEPEPAPEREPVVAGADHAAPGEEGGKPGRRGRRRQKSKSSKGPFITSEGNCAVCHRSFMAGSEEELAASGWRVSGDVGLCPDCQADGWQLPDGARLPVRPGGR